jgi:hypothetical protein
VVVAKAWAAVAAAEDAAVAAVDVAAAAEGAGGNCVFRGGTKSNETKNE